MTEVFPEIYNKFECIKGECKHSCCIGWEIDIDSETKKFYDSLEGEFGERIRENIEGDIPHFKLKEDDRCPFLNKCGLCDIILQLGEGAICDICYLHPRFTNFYDDFAETGLGLCCEEAARIILCDEEKFFIPLPDAVKDCEFFKERQKAFDILQNRNYTMLERLKKLSDKYGYEFQFSNKELYDFYTSLERLDESWENVLKKLLSTEGVSVFEREDLQVFFEQLSCYFIFRHFESGVGFTLLSCYALGAICSACESVDEMLDAVRMYSCEIEYSEENTQKVKAFLK